MTTGVSTGVSTAVPAHAAVGQPAVPPTAGSYVASPAMANASHADFVELLRTGAATPIVGDELGGGVNGSIPLVRVEDPADATRWVHAAVQDHAHGGAFDVLGHDVAVANHLEEFVVPTAWRDDLTAGLTLRHVGQALDQTTIVDNDGTVTRGIGGLRALENNMRFAGIDNGLTGAEALRHAQRSIQGVQLAHGILGSTDAHAGNLLLDLDAQRPHLVAIDFGLAGQFDDSGLPRMHTQYTPSIPIADAELDDHLPGRAKFMELDTDLVDRIANRDEGAMREAYQAYRMRTARAADVGSSYRFVLPADVPQGVETFTHRDFPGKLGFKAKVRPLNYDKWGRIVDNLTSIVRNRGLAFLPK